MKNEELDKLLSEAQSILSEHWAHCLESELEGHSTHAHCEVDNLVQKYFEALKALPEAASSTAIMEVIKRLFVNLDQLNSASDGALLETDEREILVPIVSSAAKVAGLPIHEFDNSDPTFEFRNF
jgi:hypothetical protein